MRVPLSWLKDYVDLDETAAQIAERLTFAGIEVEAIETIGSTFDGMIVGEVRSVEKHPNADKLTVCLVFDGQQELQVVCGAPNVSAGGKYPLAPVGVTMPDGKMKIKAAKLRGVESSGMLCSAVELLLSEDHSGLLTLDPKWAAGTALSTVLGPPETVFDLEITPNRPDLLSLIGIARELAAIYSKPLRLPVLPEIGSQKPEVGIEVKDSEGCPRYTARLLNNVRIGPAPDWMQRRLQHAGIRAINNVVDITNYVMLECGQPLHAFDQSLLAEGRVVVRRANAGEKMATLDGIDRELKPDTLVIADAKRAVALAGVMGGAGSEIRDQTSTVLLESACFKPSVVRATSKRLGLSTESSYRFERAVDMGGVEWASRRAAGLMAEFAGAAVAPGVIDLYPHPAPERKILCRFERVRNLVGVKAADAEITRTFVALGLGAEKAGADSCHVRVPTFRMDLEHEVDLAEEFIRIYGLDKIPSNTPRAQVDPTADDQPSRALAGLRAHVAALGLREICNYSLVAEPLLNLFGVDAATRIVLPNPISSDQSVLRTSLIPQMVETLGRNRARQIQSAGLFEIGRVFIPGAPEETRLCIGLMGPIGRAGVDSRRPVEAEEIYLWIKGIWESLASEGWKLEETRDPAFDRVCNVLSKSAIAGRFGLVKSSIRKEWRISDPVAVLEVKVATLLQHAGRVAQFSPVPAYPSVQRDVALIADEQLRNEDIVNAVRAAAPQELETIQLFDIFRGPAIGPGRKSLAYSLTYRSTSRTLTDEEVNGYHDTVKSALRQQLKVDIRET